MKVIIFLSLVFLFFSSAMGYKTLFHSHPDTVLNHLKQGNWNVYVIYFYSDYQNDQDLKNSVINNAVALYGDDLLYTEVNISKQGYSKVLNAIEFDSSRDRSTSGAVQYQQLPFVLEVVHGYGYIISGTESHKLAKDHIKELLDIGKEKKLETYH